MDVAESPELDPHSPEDEEQPALSDDDILRESGSEQDLDGAGERATYAAGCGLSGRGYPPWIRRRLPPSCGLRHVVAGRVRATL